MKTIPLTRGYITTVDDDIYEQLCQYSWFTVIGTNTFYAGRTIGRTVQTMHVFLLKPSPGMEIDHIDGDGLNNQLANLRLASHRQNAVNAPMPIGESGFRGVSFDRGRWYARIRRPDGIRKNLGRFDTPEEAAMAYDEAAREHHGEFAVLNFP